MQQSKVKPQNPNNTHSTASQPSVTVPPWLPRLIFHPTLPNNRRAGAANPSGLTLLHYTHTSATAMLWPQLHRKNGCSTWRESGHSAQFSNTECTPIAHPPAWSGSESQPHHSPRCSGAQLSQGLAKVAPAPAWCGAPPTLARKFEVGKKRK